MAHKEIIRDEDGKPTHVRETSDDGRQSTLYEYDGSWGHNLSGDHRGKPVEVSDHHKDGTTEAYEYDPSFPAGFIGHRGKKKS